MATILRALKRLFGSNSECGQKGGGVGNRFGELVCTRPKGHGGWHVDERHQEGWVDGHEDWISAPERWPEHERERKIG